MKAILTFALGLTVLLISCSKEEEKDNTTKKVDPKCFEVTAYTDQLPNFSFENWGFPDSSGGKYMEPCGGVWTSTNAISSQLNLITSYQTGDAEHGSYAVKLTTVSVLGPVTGPGVFFSGRFKSYSVDFTEVLKNAEFGVPFTKKPKSLQCYLKYTSVKGDSALAGVILTKYNAAKSARDTIGLGELTLRETTNSYQMYSIDIDYTYPSGNLDPDTVTVVFASSKEIEGLNGQVGSTLYVDNCGFVY